VTTIVDRTTDLPQIHALVIAVDDYPHCGRASVRTGEEWRLASDVRRVTCATPSAELMTRWLVGPANADAIPAALGSVELLASTGDDFTFDAGDGPVAIEEATFANVEAAFRRWRERCDLRPDNIALLYFCGHGLNVGGQDVLLLSDFGDPRYALFRNALDFSGTHQAMRHCRAEIQLYFVDACRTVPESLAASFRYAGQRFDDPVPPLPARDNPIIYSTEPEAVAPAPDGVPTPFAHAVVQALDGLAAGMQVSWEIRTDSLLPNIKMIMEWRNRGNEQTQVPTSGGICRRGLIKELRSPPMVPFLLGLDPNAALGHAELCLSSRRERLSRKPMVVPWEGSATAGSYEYTALFCETEQDRLIADDVVIHPPYRIFNLPTDQP
jgi:hypothetical protein